MINRLALLSLCLVAGAARAESRHLEATGASLAISSPCARNVTIQPDPALHGKFVLDAQAEHPEEIARLLFDNGSTAKLHISTHSCDGSYFGVGAQSTLDLTIHVPPASDLTIEESGGARYTVGAVGKLALDISGGVQLEAASTADVALSLSGGAEIKIGQSRGNMKVDVSGGGDIHIDQATLSALTLSLSGGGNFVLGGGTVDRVSLEVSGAGSVNIGAPVVDATVSMSGAGAVHIARVTGKLTKDIDGIGAVDIGSP